MTKIKICGLCRTVDIEYANQALPDYVGFVFAPSRRQVTREMAAGLRAKLDERITPVGVFVREPLEHIVQLYHQGVIRMAQLHGQESGRYIDELIALCDIPIIRAIPIDDADGAVGLPQLLPSKADYLLFDYHEPGSGRRFDWSILAGLSQPFFLAGGITGATLDDALACKPYCVDLSSGAETNGVKDAAKIQNLVQRAHAYPGGSR
ncbi:MAG: phosphoribosylanthranilate isomerase [Coriobacteriales bacterium]|jgi:phosphoribosylanthranilate isomerase|nr:phosphoribosylanthranilate isomerase [Coriobacteriales bacterium]